MHFFFLSLAASLAGIIKVSHTMNEKNTDVQELTQLGIGRALGFITPGLLTSKCPVLYNEIQNDK